MTKLFGKALMVDFVVELHRIDLACGDINTKTYTSLSQICFAVRFFCWHSQFCGDWNKIETYDPDVSETIFAKYFELFRWFDKFFDKNFIRLIAYSIESIYNIY